MSEPHGDVHVLHYVSPAPPRDADPRRMFFLLLPCAACAGVILGSWMIESTFSNGDSRNFQGPIFVFVTFVPGMILAAEGVREAFRPRGLRALLWGVGWNIWIALGPLLGLWTIVKLGLLKR